MMTGKEKSEKRRKEAAEAIRALGIPGVCTTRNLEAWLMERHRKGERVSFFVTTSTHYWGSGYTEVLMSPAPRPGGDE